MSEIKFPSIINNFDSSSYYELPFISQSKISTYLNDCEIVAHNNVFKDSDAMRFGRCFHYYLLNILMKRNFALPIIELNLRTKEGREQKSKLTSRDYWKSSEELLDAQNMVKVFLSSVKNKPNQNALIENLKANGMVEVTVFWLDQDGNKYKSRLDALIIDPETRTAHIIDLKSTEREIFDKDKSYYTFRSNDWDLQMFVYTTALMSIGYKDVKYTVIQIQRETGAYGFYNYSAGDAAFNSGADKFQRGLKNLLTVQDKVKKQIPLSASITEDIDDIIHPSYEG